MRKIEWLKGVPRRLRSSETIETGEEFPAKFGRMGFRRNFTFEEIWQGKLCATKQVEVMAIRENTGWIVITVIVKYF